MLDDLGHAEAATAVDDAVRLAISDHETTPDLGGNRSTSEVGDFLAARVGQRE
jgi:isocitrate/isopropylmalate dehydrogenase